MKRAPANVRREWQAFTAAVGARLACGQVAYQDRSLRARPDALAGEVEAELIDVCGWSFLLWRRLRSLGRRQRSAPALARRRR